MKNREKYPNTDDALKAFEKHNRVCDCGRSFEEWLDAEDSSKLNTAIAGILLGSLLGEIISAKGKPPADKEDEKPTNDGKITDVECPICHGKHGVIGGLFAPCFKCPDCGAYVGISDKVSDNTSIAFNREKFRSFIADLCEKNNRKD